MNDGGMNKKSVGLGTGGPRKTHSDDRNQAVPSGIDRVQAPVQILHVDVNELRAIDCGMPGTDFLAILWAGAVPVGQVYGRVNCQGRVDVDVLPRAAAAAAPSAPLCIEGPRQRTTSVIICTRDRADALARALTSLREQIRSPDQIIVVDNASTDERVRAVTISTGAEYVRENRPGLDIARNTGARMATGEIIAYTDDDVILHPHWLERLIAAFDSPDVMAVTGLVLPAELETGAQVLFERQWGFGRGFRRIDFDQEYFARFRLYGCPVWNIGAGANMAFRQEAFAEVGFFDERLDVGAAGCSGDSEFWYRLLAAGWTCRYEPSAVAYHFHRRERDALARQIFAYMRGHVTALLIQFERHRHWGNLRRLLVTLPVWYVGRSARRLVRGADDTNHLLRDEVRGALAGVIYYLRTPRPPGD
jgi:GT2 family glycosyltransferase